MSDETLRHIEKLLETPESFRDWLDEQPERAWVGERGRANSCPLATFLYARIEARQRLSVGGARISYGTANTPTPSWAMSFIERVDHGAAGALGIQARTARRYLREVIGK